MVAKASKVHFYIKFTSFGAGKCAEPKKSHNERNGQSLIGIAHFKLEFSFSVLIFFNEFSSIKIEEKNVC